MYRPEITKYEDYEKLTYGELDDEEVSVVITSAVLMSGSTWKNPTNFYNTWYCSGNAVYDEGTRLDKNILYEQGQKSLYDYNNYMRTYKPKIKVIPRKNIIESAI
jgi:hypothetical protein